MRHTTAIAVVLALSLPAAARAEEPADRYQWLEEVTGEKPLGWASCSKWYISVDETTSRMTNTKSSESSSGALCLITRCSVCTATE